MRSCHFSKLLILFVSFWLNGFADCTCPDAFIPCPKTYVAPEQIDIHENAIFVQVHDFILQTEYLKSDTHGIFFEKITADGCGPNKWKCTRVTDQGWICNTCNWDWFTVCQGCQKTRQKK